MELWKKYDELIADQKFEEAYRLQKDALEQVNKYMSECYTSEDAMQKAGFAKSMELQEIMDNVISKAKEENPYFPHPIPFSEVKKQDDELDLLFGSQGYNITGGWLKPYSDELYRYRVDELLDKIGFPLKYLFKLIKQIGENIRNDSDKSIMLHNNILDELNRFNEYRGSGQVIQLLFLLGIIKWFEGCDINEGDKGYNEAKNLHDSIVARFMEIYVMYSLYFDKDEHSKPLDEFLDNDETVTPFRIAMRNMSKGSDQAEEPDPDPEHSNNYEIKDYDQIQAIFNHCNGKYFESDFITFRDSIEKADFNNIEIKKYTITQDLMYRLSGVFGKDWLNEVETNMKWKRNICSGKYSKIRDYPETKRLDKLIPRPIRKED